MQKRIYAKFAEVHRVRRQSSAFSALLLRSLRHVFCFLLIAAVSVAQEKIHFTDITKFADINFVQNNGAFGKKYLPETLGPGAAFIDYDNDGWQDILLVNGQDFPGHKRRASTLKLYHNNHNGKFTDVTRAAGLEGPHEFSTSAAWVDYDKDGRLDLLVGNYVQWSPQNDLYCTLDGMHKSYCTPESYKGASARLWHNLGNGHFEDVTKKAGLLDPSSKTLGLT